jgi:predicted  nucleic acid-binding Zn-ribbon protein
MVAQDMSMQGQNPIEQRVADAQDQTQQQEANAGQNEYTQIAGMISDLDRRLRILEERYGNLRKKIQLTDQNLIDSERSINKELRNFSADILDLKRNIADFDEKVVMFGSEMDNIAQKTDLKVIEKYLAMWNPGMFVTRTELREYLKNKNIKVLGESSEDE